MKLIYNLTFIVIFIFINSCNSQLKPKKPMLKKNILIKENLLPSLVLHHKDLSTKENKLFDELKNEYLIDGNYQIKIKNCITSDIVGTSDIQKKGIIKNSLFVGEWLYLNNNDVILKKENFSTEGMLNGDFIIYNLKKEIIYKTIFNNGTGYFKDYCFNTSEIKEEGNMTDGKKEGEWKVYFLDSTTPKFKIENYKNGELVISNK